LIDFVILQQDAFDDTDSSTPMDRQRYMYEKIMVICRQNFEFNYFEECANFFKQLINVCRQMNYAVYQSDKFKQYENELQALITKQLDRA